MGREGVVGWALVTGASRGIGAAVARRLAEDGFDVIVHFAKHRAGADATAEAVREAGRRALVIQAGLGDPEAAWRLGEEAGAPGPLACIVNNAGVYDRRSMAQMTGQAWRATMAVNLDGPAAMCQAAQPRLAQGASIVHVSSIVAVRGTSHGAHYAASKAALLGFTKAQALELAPSVRVNAVCPGYVDTDMIGGDSQERRVAREREVPLGRVGSPEDVAGVVSFLCGSDSAYVTGQVLHVNGGLWMG